MSFHSVVSSSNFTVEKSVFIALGADILIARLLSKLVLQCKNRIILWKHDYLVYRSCMMGIPCNTNTSMQHNYAAKMFERMLLIFQVFAILFRFRVIVYHEAKDISFKEEMIKIVFLIKG